jgi:hypothetical protein
MERACAGRGAPGRVGSTLPLAFGLALLLSLVSSASLALDPSYLEQWPNVERVLADNRTPEANDTTARQMAALHVLRDGVEYAAGSRRWHGLTADEQRLRAEYYAAAERIREQMHSTLSNELGPGLHFPWQESPLREWYGLQWSYEGAYEFREATLRRYVAETVMPQILAETPPSLSRASAEERKGVSPVVLVGGAIVLLFVIARIARRFRARRATDAAPTSEATEIKVPDGYAELTTAQKDELAVAGRMVLDSLEPYVLAAKLPDRPFPINALTEQRISAFVLTYSRVALETIRGKAANSHDRHNSLVMFHLWIVEPQRMERLFGGVESPKITRLEGKEGKVLLFLGTWAALQALETFAPSGRLKTPADAGEPPKDDDDAPDLSRLDVPEDPPATRLHPHGPGAARGRQRILSTFSTWLLGLRGD